MQTLSVLSMRYNYISGEPRCCFSRACSVVREANMDRPPCCCSHAACKASTTPGVNCGLYCQQTLHAQRHKKMR